MERFTNDLIIDFNVLKIGNKSDKIKLRFIKLLRVAEQEIAEKGITNFKLEDLINKSGYSRGTIYTVFQTKDNLLFQLALKTYSLWASIFQKSSAHNLSPRVLFCVLQLSETITSLLYPSGFALIPYVNSKHFREKLDKEKNKELDKHSYFFINSINNIIAEAVKSEKLKTIGKNEIHALSVNLWKLIYGSSFLLPNEHSGSKQFITNVFNDMVWNQKSENFNSAETAENLLKNIYKVEHNLLLNKLPFFEM